jgi:hypothetical protein
MTLFRFLLAAFIASLVWSLWEWRGALLVLAVIMLFDMWVVDFISQPSAPRSQR